MTNKYARIEEKVAIEVFDVPEGFQIHECFHPDLAAKFSPCAPEVVTGSIMGDDGKWTAPTPVDVTPVDPEPEFVERKLSPIQFKLLFKPQERIAIKESEDKFVIDAFSIVDDLRLTEVDLNLQSTKDSVAYLAYVKLIEEYRVAEILSGQQV